MENKLGMKHLSKLKLVLILNLKHWKNYFRLMCVNTIFNNLLKMP